MCRAHQSPNTDPAWHREWFAPIQDLVDHQPDLLYTDMERRPSPMIIEKPKPYRADLLLLVDVGADRLVAVEPERSVDAVAEWTASRLREGITLRVEDEALREMEATQDVER